MVSYYSVVQYVPDPIRDERANVGVVVFGDGRVRTRFVSDWRRILAFGRQDIAYLREFARRAQRWTDEEVEIPGLEEQVRLDEAGVRALSTQWINSIQFSSPRASLLEPAELLDDVARRFLRLPASRKRAFRDRRLAASLARSTVEHAVIRRIGPTGRNLVRRNARVQGSLDQHQFDVTVQNGHVLLAAHGLSFEGPPTRELEREVDATAWAVDDVRKRDSTMPLAVVALPPRTQSKGFGTAQRVFEGLAADWITEDEAERWAETATATVLG